MKGEKKMLEVKDTNIEKLKTGILRVLNEGPGAITLREAEYSFEHDGTRFIIADGKLKGLTK